jgi:hypothetical protein
LRRVRSESAAKIPSSWSSEYLTIRFSICLQPGAVKRPPLVLEYGTLSFRDE